MRIQAATGFDKVLASKPEEVARFVEIFAGDCVNVVNGNLEFGANIKSASVRVTFTAANTDTVINHALGKPPSGYLIAGLSTNLIVYDGSMPSTKNTITLKSSAIGTATLLLF